MNQELRITNRNIQYVRDGFSHFYPDTKGDFLDGPYSSGDFSWKNRDGFNIFVFGQTQVLIKDDKDFEKIKDAQQVFELKATSPESPVERTTPEDIKGKIENAEKVEREIKKSDENAKKIVEEGIERQKELYEKESQKAKRVEADIKEKAIYVKAEQKSVEKTKEVEDLRQQAKANPKEVAEVIEKTIRERLPTAPEAAAKQAAYDIVQNLQTDNAVLINAQAVSVLAEKPEIIKTAVVDTQISNDLEGWATTLSDKNLTNLELSQAITHAAFGEAFQKEVLPDFKVSFSDSPQEGFRKFGLDMIPKEYSSLMKDNSFFLEGLKGFSVDEVKTQINLKINSFLTRQIEKLPADSTLKIAFKSDIVRGLLPGVRFAAPAAWEAVEGSFFGKIAVSSGFAPALGWLGKKTGIDFGIKKVAQIAVQGSVEGATGVTIAAGITAAFAWTGPLAPVIGAVGAFLVETIGAKVVGKAIDALKDNAQKYGKWIVAGVGAGFGLLLGGGSIMTGLVGGVLGYGIAGGIPALGAAAGAVVAGAGSFFGALATASLGAIVAPVIGFLIGFPLIIIFILFIINSGAYVVPPSVSLLSAQNEFIDVTKTASGTGHFENNELPAKVTYTITVSAKKGGITNVTIKDECNVITKAGSKPCVAPSSAGPAGGAISVGTPFTFSYDAIYNSTYKDSLVIDTVSVSANTVQNGKQETSGSASITIGKPPTDCLELDKNSWAQVPSYRANLEGAIGIIAGKYGNYLSLVCSGYTGGKLILKFNPIANDSFWGWNHNSYIDFYTLGVKNPADALYTLAHELGHSLVWRVKGIGPEYSRFPGIINEIPKCFYDYRDKNGVWSVDERLPEAIAFYIINPRCGDLQSKYPTHYKFIKKFIFK